MAAVLDPDPASQSARLDGDLMYTVTTYRFPGSSVESIRRALLDAPWNWWNGGRVTKWTKLPDGTVRFVLWPMWPRSPASMGIELGPPVASAETTSGQSRPKLVIPARFSINFVGSGRYEIVDLPGAVALRSVFDGVRRTGFMRLVPARVALDLHVRSEQGTLPFPFPKGTGFQSLR
jgi:hypothetical protein